MASKTEFKAIGIRFVRAEHAKVRRIHFEDVAEEISKLTRSLGHDLTGPWNLECVIGEVGQREGDQFAALHSHEDCHPCADCPQAQGQPVRQ